MATKKEKTSVEEIMEKSGNGFHTRVANLLREQGWSVLVSPYYNDNFSDKPREIDIIAEKKFETRAIFDDFLGFVNVRLFIECKYINGDTVFWFEPKDKARAIVRTRKDTGLDEPRVDPTINKHHYLTDVPVAKLFDSGRGEEKEVINKAINQSLNAEIFYRGNTDSIAPKTHYQERTLRRVPYPLIVVNSLERFHRATTGGDNSTTPITEPFQLEVNYAYIDKDKNAQSEYFLIDVVGIDQLPAFLAGIEASDVGAIKNKISWDEGRRRSQESQRQSGNKSAW